MSAVTYLRTGRKLRASGTIVSWQPKAGLVKVKPARDDWGHVWVTKAEIEAGGGKPAPQPRKPRQEAPAKPKRTRKPKPAPLPVWKQLVHEVRTLEVDHVPEGWPCVRMKTLTDLANELEAAQAKLAEFLPLNATAHTPPDSGTKDHE